ncbi:MAG: hemolysin family protein [Alphaproteobacteria bacterium]
MTERTPGEPAPAPETRRPDDERPQGLSGRIRALLGLGPGERGPRQALHDMLMTPAEGPEALAPTERVMLANLLRFGELRVNDVMVPRADLVAVEHTIGLEDLVRVMIEEGHSRLPVYRDNVDDVIGLVHVRDLLPFWGGAQPFDLHRILRRALFVPPSMRVLDLLLQMRTSRMHLALVVDEYGGVDGLVTIEDLVEEIVGEIQDEHDVEEGPMLVERPGRMIEANARAPIEELEARLGVRLLDPDEEEDVDTVSGMVTSFLGRVPVRGELFTHPAGVEFDVLDADPRRVKRVRVRRIDAGPEPA